jgi:ribosomal protein S8
MNFLSNRLTAIRNGKAAQLEHIAFTRPQGSRPKNIFAILTILRKRGRIRAFSFKETSLSSKVKTQYIIYLKYDSTGKSVIDSLFRVSKPSRRVYLSSSAL